MIRWKWRSGEKAALIVGVVAAVTVLHVVTPAGPHPWHGFHILYQKLYYVPVLLASAWFGGRGAFAAASAVTVLFARHILVDWAGDPMRQADQLGEVGSIWVIAVTSWLLFARERRALEETAEAHEETLAVLADSLDLREHETALHSRRVKEYSLLLAGVMGVKDKDSLENLGMGALLHDVGKIGVPDQVLLKDGPLSDSERDAVRSHPELGASLIGRVRFLAGAREIVLSHHEKFDGTGYPKGLAGTDIPMGARIFAVADVFDSLTTERPYRKPVSFGEAAELIARDRGLHFDPAVVETFLRIPFREWEEIAVRNGATLRAG
jgi:HD-GYP domain-containing protein (c-di-GMP phosphodiesterase class II)